MYIDQFMHYKCISNYEYLIVINLRKSYTHLYRFLKQSIVCDNNKSTNNLLTI